MTFSPEKYYWYANKKGTHGMTQYGVFTNDKSRWLKFGGFEAERMTADNIIPYGASRKGIFIEVQEEKNFH